MWLLTLRGLPFSGDNLDRTTYLSGDNLDRTAFIVCPLTGLPCADVRPQRILVRRSSFSPQSSHIAITGWEREGYLPPIVGKMAPPTSRGRGARSSGNVGDNPTLSGMPAIASSRTSSTRRALAAPYQLVGGASGSTSSGSPPVVQNSPLGTVAQTGSAGSSVAVLGVESERPTRGPAQVQQHLHLSLIHISEPTRPY